MKQAKTVTLPDVHYIEQASTNEREDEAFCLKFNAPLTTEQLGAFLDRLMDVDPNLIMNVRLAQRDTVGVISSYRTAGGSLLAALVAQFTPKVRYTGVGKCTQAHFDFEVKCRLAEPEAEGQLDEMVTKLSGTDGIIAVDTDGKHLFVKVHGMFEEKNDWLAHTLREVADLHVTLFAAHAHSHIFAAVPL